jgi:hypothetical protein
MQRARRFASTAVVAALAVAGLSACRSEPSVAAYLGDQRITVARVDAMYEDARTKLDAAVEQVRQQQAGQPDAKPVPDAVNLPITKQDVLSMIVGVDVLKRYAEKTGTKPQPIRTEDLVQEIPLPPDTEFIRTAVEYRGYLNGLAVAAKPATVTEADLRDVFGRLDRAGAFGQQDVTFEQWQPSLTDQQQQVLQQFIGLRNALTAEVGSFEARVNPRFGDGALTLLPYTDGNGKTAPLVSLPLSGSSVKPAVADKA